MDVAVYPADALRLVSTLLSAIVVAAFLAFAADELGESSSAQVEFVQSASAAVVDEDATDRPDPPPAVERAREAQHGALREKLEDANDALVSPFTGVVTSNDAWALRGVSALLAFLFYGFALRLLANALPGRRAPEASGWAQPQA